MNTSVLEVGCILLPENYRTWCMELERAKGARPIFFLSRLGVYHHSEYLNGNKCVYTVEYSSSVLSYRRGDYLCRWSSTAEWEMRKTAKVFAVPKT